jgi:hypothetical protein
MPRTESQIVSLMETRRSVFKLVYLRRKSQTETARIMGLTQGRISQILAETDLEFKERIRKRFDPTEMVARKLEQIDDIINEMWSAWERSKENAETNVVEEELRKVYDEFTDGNGKKTRQVSGESMQLVRKMQRVVGRLPEDRYIARIIDCLKEESRLLGLTDDAVIKITNTTNNQLNVGIDWGKMTDPPPATPDEVEAKISSVINLLPNEVGPPWSEAEAKELDDEPEHLNGDGK